MVATGLAEILSDSVLLTAELAPVGVLVTVVLAYIGYRQKLKADHREAWWHRTQWAIDSALSQDAATRSAGLVALVDMQQSPLADEADQRLLNRVAASVLEQLTAGADERTTAHTQEATGSTAQMSPADRVSIEAAQLIVSLTSGRLSTDKPN